MSLVLMRKIGHTLLIITEKTPLGLREVQLTLCDLGRGTVGGGPKDQQLSKLLNYLDWMFKSCWNVFDLSFIHIKIGV